MDGSVELRPMPASDRGFARVAGRLLDGAASPAELQARLRVAYPRAVVRERALANEPRVLYIYRDGQYRRDRRQPWWLAEGLASAVIDLGSGTIVDVSSEWADLLGHGVDAIAGRPYTDFLSPDALAGAGLVIDVLRETGEITSEAVMRRVDGSLVPFEFHATLAGDRVDIVYRRRPD